MVGKAVWAVKNRRSHVCQAALITANPDPALWRLTAGEALLVSLGMKRLCMRSQECQPAACVRCRWSHGSRAACPADPVPLFSTARHQTPLLWHFPAVESPWEQWPLTSSTLLEFVLRAQSILLTECRLLPSSGKWEPGQTFSLVITSMKFIDHHL